MTPSLMDERSEIIRKYYFTVKEAAEITRRSDTFVYKRLKEGDIEFERYEGQLMIKPDQLDKLRC